MSYPKFRTRSDDQAGTTTVFGIFSDTNICKIKANNTEYIFAGNNNTGESEGQILSSTSIIADTDYAAAIEDIANFAMGERIGATPIIRAH